MSEDITEYVREDPDLLPQEKETTLRFAKDEDTVHVYTAEAGLMRRLLAHPHFEVGEITIKDESSGSFSTTSEPSHVVGNDPDDTAVVGVRGNIPISALSLSASLRTTSDHANVVSEGVLRA